ncbi:sigma-70 family RNA polymerase sigma factor [Rubripirellula amarantea]|nr:sigma-70 family RNA polymerase sigma factor [Rubripirellula amarantea]
MDLTQILTAANAGDAEARSQLIQAAYNDLRQLAAGKMANERQDHTLSSTALVHEVSMKLLDDSRVPTESRGQFFAYASKAMRNLLIDHARTKGRQKRGGDRQKFSFDEALVACDEQRDEFLALNSALEKLAELEPRKAQVVEMRYFGGLSNQEIASALETSLATVKRDWEVARTWLLKTLMDEG